MPLHCISVNIVEPESSPRKRSHEEFTEVSTQLFDFPSGLENIAAASKDKVLTGTDLGDNFSLPVVNHTSLRVPTDSPLPGSSSPAALTECGSSDMAPSSSPPSPNGTPSKSTTLHQPTTPSNLSTVATVMSSVPAQAVSSAAPSQPQKRKRRTAAEMEADHAAKRQKQEELAAEKVAKAEAKAKMDAEKEEARQARAAKKAVVNAEKVEKEKAKAAKIADEEKKRKQQPSLFAFMKKPKAEDTGVIDEPEGPSPKKPQSADIKPEKGAYELRFKPFFVKSDVKMAPAGAFMDDKAKDIKSRNLEEDIFGRRVGSDAKPFDPRETFQLGGLLTRRGIVYPTVRGLVTEIFGDSEAGRSSLVAKQTKEDSPRRISARECLNRIPMKILSFYEDVRPCYVGTVTSSTPVPLQKIARNPTRRLLTANYDYDSELEWEEEDGEDLGDDDDEDEDGDNDDEMADFLDDAEDVTHAPRPTFLMDGAPESTGISYEDVGGVDPSSSLRRYRIEFLLPTMEQEYGIDPFSTTYWPQAKKRGRVPGFKPSQANAATTAPQLPASGSVAMAPPPNPKDAYALLLLSQQPVRTNHAQAKALIPFDVLDDFKRAIISDDINFLTKAGMVDMLAKRFSSCTRAQVKSTLETIADRVEVPGSKPREKRWALLPAFALNGNTAPQPSQIAQAAN